MPDNIERLCRSIGSRFGRLYSIAPLGTGSSGRSFLLLTESGRFVAKLFEAESMILLGPTAQAALHGPLAAAGIAPAAAFADETAGLLVTEYVADARALPRARLREPRHIEALAVLLRRLHDVEAEVPAFAPRDYARRYLASIGGIDALAPDDRERHAELVALAALPLAGPRCICHNDLTADHLLFGPSPRLIDFDYAVTASPPLDLASAIFMNGFGEAETSCLLDAYYDGAPPFPAAEFARVLRLQRLLAHFWALAFAQQAPAIVDEYRIRND